LHITLFLVKFIIDVMKLMCHPYNLLKPKRIHLTLVLISCSHQEWCQKQMEFVLLRGKRKTTKAMKAGSARHTELEEEVRF